MKNQLVQLLAAGQSVWLDNLRRSMFASGELARLIALGLRGMTSNPTIFEKAIGTSDDYDEQLRALIGTRHDPAELFWSLAIQDIRSACDLFAPVYHASQATDGCVSLEVSPLLADDTAGTIAMARDLWERVDRPNVMIKIPGTPAGLPAIEECIYAGLNINVTLIFSTEMYAAGAEAYIRGLERRLREGKPIDGIRSVNSVFVSRIDTAIDQLLQDRIAKGERLAHLLGKAGIANLKLTYHRFTELFDGARFAPIRAAGGAPQRPLWASTSTKNPTYPDLMYVEPVVGPHTVNTMPPQTLDALLDHGQVVAGTAQTGLDDAKATLAALHDARISFYDVTQGLQREGVKLFAQSFDALLAAIVYKQQHLASGSQRVAVSVPATLQGSMDKALATLSQNDALTRMLSKDATLWSKDPAHVAIIDKALGWLDIAQRLREAVPALQAFAAEIAAEFSHVVVLGMGGSSLAPDTLRVTFGHVRHFPELHVLDSTDPQQIAELEAAIDPAHTLFIVASKSGTTTEPNAFFAYFYEKVTKLVGADRVGSHFVAITDPGTPMVQVAKEHRFRRIFENDPNIGGRYSALSYFGMLPAALAGYDVGLILDRGLGAMHANAKTVAVDQAPGMRLGAALGSLALAGRDKLTILCHPSVAAFADWAEQLVAESTGKLGRGIVPIAQEPLGPVDAYGDDRTFIYVGATLAGAPAQTEARLQELEAAGHPVIRLAMNDAYDIGEQFYLWEIAVATAGSLLGIDAFDQPNVQESKENTKAILEQFARTGKMVKPAITAHADAFDITLLSGSGTLHARTPAEAIGALLAGLKPPDYLAITAYIARDAAHEALASELRVRIRAARKAATSLGFGPRFLHSTGQLHKGGPATVVTLQITADPVDDPTIPGMHVGFRTLIAAQALGDWQALDTRKRRGVRVHLHGNVVAGLRALLAAVDNALAAHTP